MVMIQVNFFHLAVVFPFLIYMALNPDKSNVRKVYPIVQIMSVSIFLYHTYLSYEKSKMMRIILLMWYI